MALDRRITVTVREPSTRDSNGEEVLGAAVEYPTWATTFDKSLEDIEGEGGVRAQNGVGIGASGGTRASS